MVDDEILGFVLIAVIIIIATIIVAALLGRQRDEDKQNFGGDCSTNKDCIEGQCLKGKCSLPKGSLCDTNTECEPETSCVMGVCATTDVKIGDKCDNSNICESPLVCNLGTCKSMAGGPCSNNSQCVSGTCDSSTNTCSGGMMSMSELLTPMQAGPVIPVLDVGGDMGTMITVQENGNMIKDNGRISTTVYGSIKPELICWARVAVFAVSDGILYQINGDMNRLYWDWHRYEKTPKNIQHICSTSDNKNLWVESLLPGGRKRGFMYKITTRGMIKLEYSKIVTGTRMYGRYKSEYAVISNNGDCNIYRDGTKVQSMQNIAGIGFDPETGETMTSVKYRRVIKTLGKYQTAIAVR